MSIDDVVAEKKRNLEYFKSGLNLLNKGVVIDPFMSYVDQLKYSQIAVISLFDDIYKDYYKKYRRRDA